MLGRIRRICRDISYTMAPKNFIYTFLWFYSIWFLAQDINWDIVFPAPVAILFIYFILLFFSNVFYIFFKMYILIDNTQRIQESEKLKLMIIPVSQLISQSILQSIKNIQSPIDQLTNWYCKWYMQEVSFFKLLYLCRQYSRNSIGKQGKPLVARRNPMNQLTVKPTNAYNLQEGYQHQWYSSCLVIKHLKHVHSSLANKKRKRILIELLINYISLLVVNS